MILEGSGQMLVDGELIPLAPGDRVRVDPACKRAINNDGATPLRLICAGAVAANNEKLKARDLRTLARRSAES